MVVNVSYLPDTGEIEVTNEFGFPTYYKLSGLKAIDANERELGVEKEYMVGDKLHVFFYPEGVLCDFYVDENECETP